MLYKLSRSLALIVLFTCGQYAHGGNFGTVGDVPNFRNIVKFAGNPIPPVHDNVWTNKGLTGWTVDPLDNTQFLAYVFITNNNATVSSISLYKGSRTNPFVMTLEQDNVIGQGPPGSWDADFVLGMPTVLQVRNGVIFHPYVGYKAGGPYQLGVATSTDGRTWTKYAGNPTYTASNGESAGGVFWPQYIMTDNSVSAAGYVFYSYGVAGPNTDGVRYLTTTDGFDWTYTGNEVLHKGGTFDTYTVEGSIIVPDGNGGGRMLYAGSELSTGPWVTLGAYSDNIIGTYTKLPYIVMAGSGSGFDGGSANPVLMVNPTGTAGGPWAYYYAGAAGGWGTSYNVYDIGGATMFLTSSTTTAKGVGLFGVSKK